MTASAKQAEIFREQARHCAPRSPLYERLCLELAEEPLVADVAADLEWDLPLRLLGGLHYLVLEGKASWDDVHAALDEHRAFLRAFTAERSVQTNEVARCWVLLPAFLLLAGEAGTEVVDAIELGPAAGFNLLWDRYRYHYAGGSWGPRDARLELGGEERRAVPERLFERRLAVRRRVGIDLEPVDVTTDEGA
ncbi:MAG TPA: DUF2332 family protein, partial [Gaiellaceae bacterium]